MREPSSQQLNALKHLSGPAEIIAGPGSGKTFTIIKRLLYLIRQCQIDPDKILVITYTRAAAKEMEERFQTSVAELYENSEGTGHRNAQKVHFGTFHSICWQILRQSSGNDYSLIGESQKRELIGHLLKNMGLGEEIAYDLVSDIVNEISRGKNFSGLDEGDLSNGNDGLKKVGTLSFEAYRNIKDGYERYLKDQKMLDFDDMLVYCYELLRERPDILGAWQRKYRYILVDEFQDINLPQYQLLKLLAVPQNNLFVVGDDDQAIYGFRGASPGIMKQFLADFPNARKLMLTENYRSGKEIVSLAKKVISQNQNRFEKEFYPMQQGGCIHVCGFESRKAEENALGKALCGLDREHLNRSAVIFRTNIELLQYQGFFKKMQIPVFGKKVSDKDILKSFIMEDMTAFLSFIYLGNRRSQLIRFMNKPNRFFVREALTTETVMWTQFQRYYQNNPILLKQAEGFWTQLKLAGRLSTDLAISLFRNALGYDRYLEEKAPDAGRETLFKSQADRIQRYLGDYIPGTDLKRYLVEKEKKNPVKEETDVREGLRLLTMHGAKGLEFDRVYLPDVNEGVIPGRRCASPKELEEERRLLYVAITRAKKELHIYYTRERGRTISRYLEGLIPPHPQLP